ncbi:TlpA family protein disulfide reductase [Halorubrum sp. Eb13]|uniref:TlpA family protein disulfide reductase n=1 Tax=Halorubrum sp. Eb13 TaxID=1383843 RepID=UPI00113FDDEB|nr:TlpA family protein disulfide reductase [Halorubrum sp. Eb13]
MDTRHPTRSRSDRFPRRRVIAAAAATGVGALAGCLGSDGESGTDDGGDTGSDGADDGDAAGEGSDGSTGEASATAWRTTELTDVLTDEAFRIDELEGPVAIQSFAVWCPNCERQSESLSRVDESVTVVSLNTDPNEDAEKVRNHAEENDFDWRFAVAPAEMTQSLIDAFGAAVTNAPSTPIIVACDDGVAEFFSGSQQSATEIEAAADEC